MTYLASAPGRCGIVGNPSDLYGGRVLSCSLPARATCRLTLGEAGPLPEDPTLWNAIMARVPLEGPFKVEWSTDVPRSSGLSGSTALLTATLACVLAARNEAPDLSTEMARTEFAMLARDVERHHANVVCGYQDAYMIVHGGLRLMDFAGKGPVEPGPLPTSELLEAPLPFLLVTTGVERLSGSVHGLMVQRWLDGDKEVVETMNTLPKLANEGAAALQKGDLEALGQCMDENHRLVAHLGGSGEAIDTLIGHCKQAGAIGAKLAGAGMGGTVIALTEDADALQAALVEKGYSRFLRPLNGPGLTVGA